MKYELRQLLLQRLDHKGIEKNLIPGFLRSLANSIDVEQNTGFKQIKRRMRRVGWDDIELDYHTFELAYNFLEAEGFAGHEYKPSDWYEAILIKF